MIDSLKTRIKELEHQDSNYLNELKHAHEKVTTLEKNSLIKHYPKSNYLKLKISELEQEIRVLKSEIDALKLKLKEIDRDRKSVV